MSSDHFGAFAPHAIEVYQRRGKGRIRWFLAGFAVGALAVQLLTRVLS